ncbi:hypothetical protein KY284_029995 [Solanum tuberosum]|nr:hypothetical protein KY284_029995 [Solanum tuberosum]
MLKTLVHSTYPLLPRRVSIHPVYGVGEMDESITPSVDILAFSVLYSENILVCSPTLVLSGNKSQNSEVQSVAKLNVGLPSEEIDIGYMAVSSTISERLFERDLLEGKGLELCILISGAELVAVQSLASLRGDVPHRSEPIFDQTPKSFDVVSDQEEEEEIPLRWRSRGMRGENQSQVNIPELETVKGTSEIDIVGKSVEREKERQRKGKGKLVLSHSKGDKMKYVTRSETQKRRREGLEPEQPTSTPLSIENSETESEDAAKYVAKRRREAEEERVKSKGNQKGGKKSHVQKVKVKKQKYLAKGEKGRKQLEEQPIKGPGPKVKNQIEENELTREERVEKMENIRDHFRVPVEGIRTIEDCKPSSDFIKLATKCGDVKNAGLPKKFLKGEYQLLFEFINKVLVPRTEKRTVASDVDLSLMEKLDELEEINLPAIMLEHMHRVMTWKKVKHGIPYGYLLNFVFNHFEMPLGRRVPSTTKQMFTAATLLECECVEGKARSRAQVADNAVSRGPGTSDGNEKV